MENEKIELKPYEGDDMVEMNEETKQMLLDRIDKLIPQGSVEADGTKPVSPETAPEAPSPEVGPKEPVAAVGEAETCPRCGYREAVDPSRINDGDKQEFLRSILGNRAFVKDYQLFNGQLILVFRGLMGADAESLNKLLNAFDSSSTDELINYTIRLKLLYMFAGVSGENLNYTFEIPELTGPDDVLQQFKNRFKGLSEPVIRGATKCLFLFESLYRTLLDSGLDENFWKGAGRV